MSNAGVSVGSSLFWIWQMLMIAERTVDGFIYSKDQEVIDEMNGELTKVVNDFMRVADVEVLRLAKKSGKCPLFRSGKSASSVISCRASALTWAA